MIELLTASFLLAADLPEQPKVSCDKVRWFVQTYGEAEALRLARKWGYSEATIKAAQKCLPPARSS